MWSGLGWIIDYGSFVRHVKLEEAHAKESSTF